MLEITKNKEPWQIAAARFCVKKSESGLSLKLRLGRASAKLRRGQA